MYCIECGAPIDANARTCGACRFPQPLEEFADLEQTPGAAAVQKPVLPVRFVDALPSRNNRTRLAAVLATFVALCISTGLLVYLLTRQPSGVEAAPASTASPAKAEPESGSEPAAEPAKTDPPQPTSGIETGARQD